MPGYGILQSLMRITSNPDFFSGLPMQTAQHVIRQVCTDFKGWLASLKKYRKDPSGYTGKPKMPGYCRNDTASYLFTNQDAVIYDGKLEASSYKDPHSCTQKTWQADGSKGETCFWRIRTFYLSIR